MVHTIICLESKLDVFHSQVLLILLWFFLFNGSQIKKNDTNEANFFIHEQLSVRSVMVSNTP